jgi:hypothetical protein
MNLIWLSSTGVFVLLGFTFAVLFRRLSSTRPKMAVTGNCIFAASRYKPLDRLLDPLDYRFLQSQTAYSRRIVRRLRGQRIEIFRGYLRCLARDFSRVSSALKLMMVQSSVDRSALAALLLKQRIVFSVHMMSIEASLVLYSLGLSVPTVDVQRLVDALDAMRVQLQALAAAPQPSASAA